MVVLTQLENAETYDVVKDFNGKSLIDLETRDILHHKFLGVNEAEKFYYAYAHTTGFSVRRGRLFTCRSTRLTSRTWLCSAEGWREPNPNGKAALHLQRNKKETRFGCLASLRIQWQPRLGKYMVVHFHKEHSHPLAMDHERQLLLSNRVCDASSLGQALQMRSSSVKICHAFECISDNRGGYLTAGFKIKDMYNGMDRVRRKIMVHGDSSAALLHLQDRAEKESNFYCKFKLDEENRLANVFWRDGRSHDEYKKYNDVLMFDATYKTNSYGMPLVLFVGTTNQNASTIFGFGLLKDEKTETYVWLLQTFLESMKGKQPEAVLTDGDNAMRGAIEIVFVGKPHRLCSWHIGQNIIKNITNKKLRREFHKIMWGAKSPEEFDSRYQQMLVEYPVQARKKLWFDDMYAKREKWAEVYCKGKFFARMRSTQRNERMNRHVKDFLTGTVKLCELVHGTEKALAKIRMRNAETEWKCRSTQHVLLSQLKKLEDHASKIYTDSAFSFVQIELLKTGTMVNKDPSSSGDQLIYGVYRYDKREKKFQVHLRRTGDIFYSIECSCRKVEYEGIPCRHIFHVLKVEGYEEIPTFLIKNRWTKAYSQNWNFDNEEDASDARIRDLQARISTLASVASMPEETYAHLEDIIGKFAGNRFVSLETHKTNNGPTVHTPPSFENLIMDPERCVSKAKEKLEREGKKKRKTRSKCRKCDHYGHNITTCGKKRGRPSSPSSAEECEMTNGGGSESDDILNPKTKRRLFLDDAFIPPVFSDEEDDFIPPVKSEAEDDIIRSVLSDEEDGIIPPIWSDEEDAIIPPIFSDEEDGIIPPIFSDEDDVE